MNTFSSRFMATFALVAMILTGLGTAMPTQAATMSTLIKSANSSTVYWYSNNGKRYVYPNIKTFWSWFTSNDLKNVKTVSNSELANIQLGGNVTYRPGYRLVKSASSERVYAVSRYGVLRWITSEQVARDLYGWDWNTKIDDIADEFFSNYTIGNPIWNSSDYNVSAEYNGVYSPNDNIGNNNGNYNYNNGSNSVTQNNVTVTVSNTSITEGSYVTVTANTSDTSYATFTVYDERTGTSIQNCYNVGSCSVSQQLYRRNGEASMRFYVVVSRNGYNTTVYSPYVSFNSSYSGNGTSVTQNNVTVSTDRTTINSGDRVSFTATSNDSSYATFTMYDERTNTVLQTCYNVGTCSTSQYVYRNNSEASMRVYVVVNRNGNSVSVYSPYVSFNGSNNGNNNTQNNITVSVDRSSINDGDTVLVTATANDSLNATYTIYDDRTGTALKTCYGTSTCAVSQQIYRRNNETSMRFYVVTNRSGNYTTTYSPYVTINTNNNCSYYGNCQNNNGFDTSTSINASVSSRFNDTNGENIVFSANVVNPITSYTNVTVYLYDQNNNQLLKTCSANTYCAVTLNSWSPVTRTLYARAVDQNGRSVESSRTTVTYGNTTNNNQTVTTPVVTSPSQNQMVTAGNQLTVNWTSSARRHTVSLQCATCNGYTDYNAPATTVTTDSYQTSYTFTLPTTQTWYRVRVQAVNDNGNTSDWSYYVYFNAQGTVVNNPPVNNGPFTANTNVSLNRTTATLQDTVNITANVTNYNVATSALTVRIFDERDNRLLGTCSGVSNCVVNTYVWRVDGQPNTFRYYAIVDNGQGNQLPAVYSPSITLSL